MTRKFKKGSYTAVLSLIVIAAVILFNMIISRLPEKVRQWDMSSSQIFTVGDTTKEILSKLDKDVTIYVVGEPGHVDSRITNFVNRYADLSPHIQIEAVDPVLHPTRLDELGADNNSLLVRCDTTNKSQNISFEEIIKYDPMSYYYYGQIRETEFDGEGKLTSAVSYVTNEVQKMVYQTEGHGEVELGVSASDMLNKSNLTLKAVNLLKDGGIPEDCELLIINSPSADLADDEKTQIMDYLDHGGRVMVFAGYSEQAQPNLDAVLQAYGLKLADGLAADTKNYYQNNPYNIFPTYKLDSDVMNGIDPKKAALVSKASALTVLEAMPEGVKVQPFMETSDQGLLVTTDGQIPGTYILGAASVKTLDSGSARLTVFSTPSLIDDGINTTFTNLSNLEIFMNAAALNFDDVTNVSIPSKSLAITYNTVTNAGTWGLLFILVIPVVTLVSGLVVWRRRRRS